MKEYQEMISRLKHGSFYLFTIISGRDMGKKMILQGEECSYPEKRLKNFWENARELFDKTQCPYRYETAGEVVFAERLASEPELVICGGGHISVELAALADYMEYSYTVIDNREEFASDIRFPRAKACLCMPFEEALRHTSFSENAYYIIVTRGHAEDRQCLELILNRPAGYIGMIGSKNKVTKTMEILLECGYEKDRLEKVHAPIGLQLGGQTPKEIAVSVIGELIQIKNDENPAGYLDEDMKLQLTREETMVLVRIIGKCGSSPRGIGSRMLVNAQGIMSGTIGGGMIEYKAVEQAKELMGSGKCLLKSYHLDTDTAASIGMWCGGDLEVLFEA